MEVETGEKGGKMKREVGGEGELRVEQESKETTCRDEGGRWERKRTETEGVTGIVQCLQWKM